MNWFLKALKNYAGFSGRSQRAEFWFFFLFFVLFLLVLKALEAFLGLETKNHQIGYLSTAFSVALMIPYIAVGVRRLHDTSRSGWWILVGLVPIVGFFVLLFYFCLDSTPGTNQYGENPKGIASAEA